MNIEVIENAKKTIKEHSPDVVVGLGVVSMYATLKDAFDDLSDEQKQRIRDFINKQEEAH